MGKHTLGENVVKIVSMILKTADTNHLTLQGSIHSSDAQK